MRTAFIETLCELAKRDERIWLLTGDLGYSVLECFASRFPDRFVNVGVAEQNMTGVAAGLALCGKIVFIYSIANFPIMRCLEQIRNDVCYHNLNVKIVAVGGGLAYGPAGYTHHAVEDLAVMRAMPNMTIVAPGDPVETGLATRAIANWPGPCYLRLGKTREPVVHQTEPEFQIGKAIVVQQGRDTTLISTGGILELVVRAAHRLNSEGYSAQVLSMPTLCPLDKEAILLAARQTGRIITVEEHDSGGLGSAVAEVLAQAGCSTSFLPLRLALPTATTVGAQVTLRAREGLSLDGIVSAALRLVRGA
jgi:transketolase